MVLITECILVNVENNAWKIDEKYSIGRYSIEATLADDAMPRIHIWVSETGKRIRRSRSRL